MVEAEVMMEVVMVAAGIALPGMTPTAATLGADVRAAPAVGPGLRSCFVRNSDSSRKKCDLRQKQVPQPHSKAPQPPLGKIVIMIAEPEIKNCHLMVTVDKKTIIEVVPVV
jgi:hypothetical protein